MFSFKKALSIGEKVVCVYEVWKSSVLICVLRPYWSIATPRNKVAIENFTKLVDKTKLFLTKIFCLDSICLGKTSILHFLKIKLYMYAEFFKIYFYLASNS